MKKYIRVLSVLAPLMELLIYGLFAVSMFTLVSSLVGSLTPVDGKAPFSVDVSPSGDAVFLLKVRNQGLLEATMRFRIEIMLKDEVVAGEKSATLPPNAEEEVGIKLKLTERQMEEVSTQNPKVFLSFEGRTLNGLAGMGVKAQIGGAG